MFKQQANLLILKLIFSFYNGLKSKRVCMNAIIVYNAKIAECLINLFNVTGRWRAGVYELLDNLAFYDFDNCVSDRRYMLQRWKLHIPRLPYHAGIV